MNTTTITKSSTIATSNTHCNGYQDDLDDIYLHLHLNRLIT